MPVEQSYSLRELDQLEIYFKDGRSIEIIGDDSVLRNYLSLSFNHRDLKNIERIIATFVNSFPRKKIVKNIDFKIKDKQLILIFPIKYTFTPTPKLTEQEKKEREIRRENDIALLSRYGYKTSTDTP